MSWIKRLFGIKEVEPQGVQMKESYYSLRGTSKTTPNPIDKEKRMREIVEAERIRRDKIYERSRKKAREDESDFLTSMTVAAVTDSTLIGAAVGGDIFGAIVGDALNDSDSNTDSNSDSGFDGGFGGGDFSGGGASGSWDDSSSSSSNSYDSSSSYDSDSSYDPGSSYDSSSSSDY